MGNNFKFYQAENATRLFNINGQEVLFQPCQYFGGTWRGIYATDVPEIQAGLDHLATDKTKAVTVITREEYEQKRGSLPSHLKETYNPVDRNQVVCVAAPVTPTKSGQEAVVESDPEAKQEVRNPEEPQAEGQPVAEASEALNVGPITPTESATKPKPGKKAPKPAPVTI
jgi:hypothetical protein